MTLFNSYLFTDMRGFLMHVDRPAEDAVPARIPISGALMVGWQSDADSDLELVPDESTLVADPFSKGKLIFAQPVEPGFAEGTYSGDTRAVAKRAERLVSDLGIADEVRVGVELEFNVLRAIRFATTPQLNLVELAEEDSWSGNSHILSKGHRLGHGSMHHMIGPADQHAKIRREIYQTLAGMGYRPCHEAHEAGPSQHEIAMMHSRLSVAADQVQLHKHVVRTIADKYDRTATFMPRPIPSAASNGMHVNISLWKNGVNLLFDQNSRGKLTELGLAFTAGILTHIRSLNAFTNPTVNSYKRLNYFFSLMRPAGWGYKNRTCAIRIPYADSERSMRVEVRFPDPSANPYLCLAALICAGVDGIVRGLVPPPAEQEAVKWFEQPFNASSRAKAMAPELLTALDALHEDRNYLKRGDVFCDTLIDSVIQDGSFFWHWAATTPAPVEYQVFYGH